MEQWMDCRMDTSISMGMSGWHGWMDVGRFLGGYLALDVVGDEGTEEHRENVGLDLIFRAFRHQSVQSFQEVDAHL